MKKRGIIFFSIVFVLICAIFLGVKTGWLKVSVDSSSDNYQTAQSEDDSFQEMPGEILTNQEEISGEGGVKSEGGSDGSSTIFGSGCDEIQISYSLKNFESFESCLVEENGICLEKQINCTIDVNNLDDLSRSFELNVVIFDESNYEEIDSRIVNKEVSSGDSEPLFEIFGIVSSGEEGFANKNLECSFETTNVPKKEVC